MSDSDDETPSQPKRTLVDDNAGLHPLFWDAMPEEAEKDPTWQALEALKEESTPEERANNFKVGRRWNEEPPVQRSQEGAAGGSKGSRAALALMPSTG